MEEITSFQVLNSDFLGNFIHFVQDLWGGTVSEVGSRREPNSASK
jgi:hypothetical protein